MSSQQYRLASSTAAMAQVSAVRPPHVLWYPSRQRPTANYAASCAAHGVCCQLCPAPLALRSRDHRWALLVARGRVADSDRGLPAVTHRARPPRPRVGPSRVTLSGYVRSTAGTDRVRVRKTRMLLGLVTSLHGTWSLDVKLLSFSERPRDGDSRQVLHWPACPKRLVCLLDP